MQDIATSILNKEKAYLDRIEGLLTIIAEQAEKLARYKQTVEEAEVVAARREEAEQIMLQSCREGCTE